MDKLFLMQKTGLSEIEIDECVSHKKTISILKSKKFPFIDGVDKAIIEEKKRKISGQQQWLTNERILNAMYSFLSGDVESTTEKQQSEAVLPLQKTRSGIDWFNVKKMAEKKLSASTFASKYPTSSMFADFASNTEVELLTNE